MTTLRFTPRLNGFKPDIADDVLTAENGNMPIFQRLDTHKPYDVSVSFLLNGADHNELLEFWREHDSAYIKIKLTLQDSELKYYDCLILDGPTIQYKAGAHQTWEAAAINDGKQDVKNCYFESTWQLLALVPHRYERDLQIIDDYEFLTDDLFAGYVVVK